MRIALIIAVISISIPILNVQAELIFNTHYMHPESIAIHGKYLWISDNATDKLHRLDLGDGSVGTSTDYMFSGLTFFGDYLYGIGGEPGSHVDARTIYKMNPEDGTILSSLPLQFYVPGPCGLAHDGYYFWVSNGSEYSRIYKVDPNDGSLVESFDYEQGFCPAGLAHDGTNLWIGQYNPDMIHKVNPANGAIISSFVAPDSPGGLPVGIDFDDEYKLWVIIANTGNVYRLDVGVIPPDTIPPSAVTDLTAVMGSAIDTMNLAWTSPGDDGNIGKASKYIIRYDTVPISESNWDESYNVDGEPIPRTAGHWESMIVTMPHPSAIYYFAIKTQDEVPNTSGVSNSPHVKSNAIHLDAGWNLFSLHIRPSSNDPGVVLSSIYGMYNSVWGHDPDKGWSVYVPEGVSDLDKLELGKGYWIKMDQPGTLIIDGIDPPTIWVPLEGEAWNLVGYSCRECRSVEECISGIAYSINSVWEYYTVSGWSIYAPGGPSDLEFMKPGYGYWIEANENCLWNVNQ